MSTVIPTAIPAVRPGHGFISRISVESNDNGKRFVISIRVPAKLPATEQKAAITLINREIDALVKTATSVPEGQQPDATIATRIVELKQQLAEAVAMLATLVDVPEHYEYFSTPRSSEDSVRINAQQLRNAFPELMKVASDDKVFLTLLTERSRFANREVNFTVSDQIDPVTKQVKRGPKGQVYTNVRLEASSDNLTEQDAAQLWGSDTVASTTTSTPSEAMPGDPVAKDMPKDMDI